MKKVTVIIPCYNSGDYIVRCLDSLKKQTYKDFSIIVVDDASTDKTGDIVENYKSNNNLDIHLLRNKINLGPAESRNRGIVQTDSDYIAFCDSDDWYEKDFLLKMMEGVLSNDADIVFCGYSIVECNNKSKIPMERVKKVLSPEEALILDVDSLCMTLVKANIMKSTLLPSIRNGEDMAVIPLLISKSSKCVFVSESLYNYYRRENSVSETPTMKTINSLVTSYEYIYSNLSKKYDKELEYIGIRNLLYPTLINLFSFSNDTKKAREILCLFEKKYSEWYKNNYISKLPMYKKVVLCAAHFRCFFIIRVLAFIRKKRVRK